MKDKTFVAVCTILNLVLLCIGIYIKSFFLVIVTSMGLLSGLVYMNSKKLAPLFLLILLVGCAQERPEMSRAQELQEQLFKTTELALQCRIHGNMDGFQLNCDVIELLVRQMSDLDPELTHEERQKLRQRADEWERELKYRVDLSQVGM